MGPGPARRPGRAPLAVALCAALLTLPPALGAGERRRLACSTCRGIADRFNQVGDGTGGAAGRPRGGGVGAAGGGLPGREPAAGSCRAARGAVAVAAQAAPRGGRRAPGRLGVAGPPEKAAAAPGAVRLRGPGGRPALRPAAAEAAVPPPGSDAALRTASGPAGARRGLCCRLRQRRWSLGRWVPERLPPRLCCPRRAGASERRERL